MPHRPVQTALPSETDLPPDVLVHDCALLGARLAATIRDAALAESQADVAASRAAVAGLLEQVPGGRLDVLAIALAAMVDAEATPGQLLTWTSRLPTRHRRRRRPRPSTGRAPGRPRLPREHGTDRGYYQHTRTYGEPACPPCRAAHAVESRPAACRAEFARLVGSGVDPVTAAELSLPARVLSAPHRSESAA